MLTITEWLRQRSDDELGVLLRRRPDLALPAPIDFATLANRISVRSSLQRAIDQLDSFHLTVLSTLVLCAEGTDNTDIDTASALLHGVDLVSAVDQLRTLALVWGSNDNLNLYLTTGLRLALGPYPVGLGRSAADLPGAANSLLADPAHLAKVLQACGPAEREVLTRLAAGPPIGMVRDASLIRPYVTPHAGGNPDQLLSDEITPPHRLIARGLLVPIDADTVELPLEVGIALRGGFVVPTAPSPEPEPLGTTSYDQHELNRRACTAAMELLRLVDKLGQNWAAHPPALMRAGGVGARELRRTARELAVPEPTAGLIAEVAAAAGLLAPTHSINPVYLPTTEYDHWLAREPAQRWIDLAMAWLTMPRQPSLISQRDERGRVLATLGPDVDRGSAAPLRRNTLAVLDTLPAGQAPTTPADVLARLAWLSPRRAASQRTAAEGTLGEAEFLGFTAAGALTDFSRPLLHDDVAAASAELTLALPEPLDDFLLQPDLTIVVAGPPTPGLAHQLSQLADLESSGGASVYRVTESTLRRALDMGSTSVQLKDFFTSRSRTPVPQALTYLIDDVTRRHGVLRTGAASAYLRCDDEALLTRVMSDPTLARLELRSLAPTVVVSSSPINTVLELLRTHGYAPSAESSDGAVVALGHDEARAPIISSRRGRSRAPNPPAHFDEIVMRLRVTDRTSRDQLSSRALLTHAGRPVAGSMNRSAAPPTSGIAGGQPGPVTQTVGTTRIPDIPGVTTAATLGLLRDAIRASAPVLLGYVDGHGQQSQHVIVPISMAGGTLRGHDTTSGALEAFALHHITAVALASAPK